MLVKSKKRKLGKEEGAGWREEIITREVARTEFLFSIDSTYWVESLLNNHCPRTDQRSHDHLP